VTESTALQFTRTYLWRGRLTELNIIYPHKAMNTSPPIPPLWDRIVAGCFVDTMAPDTASEGSCSSSGDRMGSEAGIVFSVGTQLYGGGDYWIFTDSGVSVSWSGACTGSGSTCGISGSCTYVAPNPIPVCPALGSRTATATVTYQGSSRSYTVYASDDTRDNSGPIQ